MASSSSGGLLTKRIWRNTGTCTCVFGIDACIYFHVSSFLTHLLTVLPSTGNICHMWTVKLQINLCICNLALFEREADIVALRSGRDYALDICQCRSINIYALKWRDLLCSACAIKSSGLKLSLKSVIIILKQYGLKQCNLGLIESRAVSLY